VLGAITPEGRTSNLGEILLNGTKSKLDVTTQLQVFGLLTAEPYFAVTMPSDLVVMENAVRKDTKRKIEEMDAKYELLQRGQYERLASERQAGADREALAKAAAPLRVQAEDEQKIEADRRARAEAERNAAQSATASMKLEAEAARVSAQAEADRARLAAQEADRLRLKTEAEKAELRAQLLRQFNSILETRDTARGLIVNMSDVLFDTAKYALRPAARERLAKVAGILLGHPGLNLEVEGHTDSVGGEAYNQLLSEQRAASVRDYLIEQGIAGMNLSPAKGFGESQPVATNDTAVGRQSNRRVELIVSGELIGTQIALLDGSR